MNLIKIKSLQNKINDYNLLHRHTHLKRKGINNM